VKLQAGCQYKDGTIANTGTLRALMSCYEDRSTDIVGHFHRAFLLMTYRGDRVSPQEQNEDQPVLFQGLALTWDGRLDNRTEIAELAGLPATTSLPDPLLVTRAFSNCGDLLFRKLIGEFAFVIWEELTDSLVFCRSICGSRSLYFVVDKMMLAWSSDFAHLVRISDCSVNVNDTFALEFLASDPHRSTSPLKNVEVVPPGSSVHFRRGQHVNTQSFWNPHEVRASTFATDQQYEDALTTELTRAVRCRIRTDNPIFAEASGGLDSSTLILLADQILQGDGADQTTLHTVSFTYDVSKTCDETFFINKLETLRGRNSHYILEQQQRMTLGLHEVEFTGVPNPLHLFPGRYSSIERLMRSCQARVLLTGIGGDHLFLSHADGASLVADLLLQGRLVAVHRSCRVWSQAMAIPYFTLLCLRAIPLGFAAVLPGLVRDDTIECPEWLTDCGRDRLFEASLSRARSPSFRYPSSAMRVKLVELMIDSTSAGYFNEYPDIFVSHCYTFKPLIEFCLSLPTSQFLRPRETRSVMRRAFRHILPSQIANRSAKALVDEAICRTINRCWNDIGSVRDLQVCERGYVNHARLSNALTKARVGIGQAYGLCRLFSLERWLRSLNHIRSSAILARATGEQLALAVPHRGPPEVPTGLRGTSVEKGGNYAVRDTYD